MMISKIADRHLSREACIYIRQSTMGQVRFNQESTERQYNLASKAQSLGWSSERIRVLDRDLGHSGARTTNREDFKTLVSDVAMGQVGAIFRGGRARILPLLRNLLHGTRSTGSAQAVRQGSIGSNPAVIGGTVIFGSNTSTSKQAEAAIKATEALRAELIGKIDLRLVEEAEGVMVIDVLARVPAASFCAKSELGMGRPTRWSARARNRDDRDRGDRARCPLWSL